MSASSELPRRPTLGLRLAAAADGLRVVAVRPSAAAVLAPGDLLLALDDAPLADPLALAAHLRTRRAGDPVTLLVRRAERERPVTLDLTELSRETYPEAHVLYDMVEQSGARLRTILTLPERPGPRPAWLLLPGHTCASVDLAVNPGHPLAPLVAGLTAAGAITLRVERPGLGDSEGPPCRELGLHAELACHAAGLALLAADPRVGELALFGHSLGGMLAPLLAARAPVARVAVHGTTAAPWDRVLGAALARAAALADRPVAVVRGAAHTGRSPDFDRELAAIDLPAAWAAVTADVLVARGERDELVDRDEAVALHALLAGRPRGSVRLLELPGQGHADLGHPALLAALAP